MQGLRWILLAVGALMTAGLAQAAQAGQGAHLQPYRDEAELSSALARWRSAAQKLPGPRLRLQGTPVPVAAPATTGMAPTWAQEPAADMAAKAGPAGAADGADGASESITNVQTQGVDEGGIVKQAGDHLVILRRGRLFTVRVGGDELRPVAMLDAYAPGADPRGAWYDELLVSGSTVVVIGYSYARGGTEIGLFELGRDGALAYRATYHLRSADYYASRNYASRLVDGKLVFYAPTLLQPWAPSHVGQFPALRRWGAAGAAGRDVPADFERILPATRIYRTDDDFDPALPLALHTVTQCELGRASLRCEASAVLGPAGRVFYVSAASVYVWTTGAPRGHAGERPEKTQPPSALFRLPLDGDVPTAIKTAGVPVDPLSFLEERDGHLSVLLHEAGPGEGMWGAERSHGRLALLRLPLSALGDGRGVAASEWYRRLPGPTRGALHNRHVGDWLLWGGEDGAWALRPAARDEAVALAPGHAVERIEALGEHALLVGNAGSELRFSAVRLQRGRAALAGTQRLPDAQQGETRTHGFFYRQTGREEGLLGLPVLGSQSMQRAGWRSQAAHVVFLRQRDLDFTALGDLAAAPAGRQEDGCRASCVDWYGNARPIFLGQRVLALMGYELVEGQLRGRGGDERIETRRAINFWPTPPNAWRLRPTPFD